MDPYVYPGTNILQNRRDIRDDGRLRTFEANASTRRLIELRETPLAGSFDANHLRQIHRYIFQDVYHWAGEFRTVNISRAGQFPYAFPNRIDGAMNKVFGELRAERQLASLDPGRFAVRAAHYLGEINAVHPFREGNGRTQREFIRQLAHSHGHTIDWRGVSRESMYDASHLSFQRGDNSGLEIVLRAALRPEQQKDRETPIATVSPNRDSRLAEALRTRDAINARQPPHEKERERER